MLGKKDVFRVGSLVPVRAYRFKVCWLESGRGAPCRKVFPSVKAVLSVSSNRPAGWVCISCVSFVVDIGRHRTDRFKAVHAAAWGPSLSGAPKRVVAFQIFVSNIFFMFAMSALGTAVVQWLSCYASNRKVTGSIPAGVSGFFIDIKSFRSHYDPRVDSASNRNEYQEHFLGVKAAGA